MENVLTIVFQNVQFKKQISEIVEEAISNQSPRVRECSAKFVAIMLETWNLQPSDLDEIQSSVVRGLEDASVRVRETARVSYLLLRDLDMERGEVVKGRVRPNIRIALERREGERDEQNLSLHAPLSSSSSSRIHDDTNEEDMEDEECMDMSRSNAHQKV